MLEFPRSRSIFPIIYATGPMRNDLETVRLSRRTALGYLSSGIGTIVAAACAPISPSTNATVSVAPTASANANATPAAAAPGGATPQPRSGGTLRYGTGTDVNRL